MTIEDDHWHRLPSGLSAFGRNDVRFQPEPVSGITGMCTRTVPTGHLRAALPLDRRAEGGREGPRGTGAWRRDHPHRPLGGRAGLTTEPRAAPGPPRRDKGFGRALPGLHRARGPRHRGEAGPPLSSRTSWCRPPLGPRGRCSPPASPACRETARASCPATFPCRHRHPTSLAIVSKTSPGTCADCWHPGPQRGSSGVSQIAFTKGGSGTEGRSPPRTIVPRDLALKVTRSGADPDKNELT